MKRVHDAAWLVICAYQALPCRIPLTFIDVNAVPGSLVYSNGIRVRL